MGYALISFFLQAIILQITSADNNAASANNAGFSIFPSTEKALVIAMQ
jgi:hypothetical protein